MLLHGPLTPRQAMIRDLILGGEPNKSIAQQLELSDKTVKNHVSAILLAYDVDSRCRLIALHLKEALAK